MDFEAVVVKEEKVVDVNRVRNDGKYRVDYYIHYSDGSVLHVGTWE